MGRQYNRRIKQKRSRAYLKRKTKMLKLKKSSQTVSSQVQVTPAA